MSTFKSLLKVQLLEMFGINKAIHSKDKWESGKMFGGAIFVSLATVIALFSSIIINYYFYKAMQDMSIKNYSSGLAMTFFMASFLILITTTIKVNGSLFGYKNFDIIMSYPIKGSTVLYTKIIYLYLMNFEYALIIMAPSLGFYLMFNSFSLYTLITGIIAIFITPLMPILIAILVGFLITFMSSIFIRIKGILTTIFYLSWFFIIYFVSNSSSYDIGKDNSDIYNKLYPLTNTYINGIVNNYLSFILFLLISIVPLIIVVYLIGKNYQKINSFLTSKRLKKSYNLSTYKVKSVKKTLFNKELKKFISIPLYVLNSIIAIIFALISTIIIVILFNKGGSEDAIVIHDYINENLHIIVTSLAFFYGTSTSTSASISLEGKNLWVIKSLPIDEWSVLNSKLKVSYIFNIPFIIISGLILTIGLKMSDEYMILGTFLIPVLICVFTSILGILYNLLFPNFDFTNELVPIKQGLPVFLSMISGTLISMLGLFITIICGNIGILIFILLLVIVDIFLYILLVKYATKMFRKIEV